MVRRVTRMWCNQACRPEWIALLGRRDHPTDAVEEYCCRLAHALAERHVSLELVRMPWAELGWLRELGRLWRESAAWQGKWVLVQYTALQWSRRGFPLLLLAVLRLLRRRQVRVVMVFHDPAPFAVRSDAPPANLVIDWMRSRLQKRVMRAAYFWATHSIHTVPVELVPWLPPRATRAAFIPVGANVPETDSGNQAPVRQRIVSVFSVTGGQETAREVADIAHAMKRAAERAPGLRLTVLGRNSQKAIATLRRALDGANVELSVLGLLPAEEISQVLSGSDALLFVRGPVSSGRGSAIAAVASGLPIVGYEGAVTTFPMTAAGVMLVPQGDREALGDALTRVLTDESLRLELRRRNRIAHQDYFSWDVIAGRFLQVLAHE